MSRNHCGCCPVEEAGLKTLVAPVLLVDVGAPNPNAFGVVVADVPPNNGCAVAGC